MDILKLIKDKLTDSVIEKVSNFLGEHPENISSALNSSVPIVLGGIMRSASNDEETGKVMDILKDGGHTGEILDDLPNLLGNFDKTQLLITIGSNIFNHFSGNKSNSIVEKLSTLTDIRKTSASSLVGLAAPLVLGALGKVVSKEGLGVSGLTRLLADQRESVFGALPPAIANQLNFKGVVTENEPENEEKSKELKKENTANRGAFSWIPWVLIGLLFLAGLAYFWKYRKNVKPTDPTTEVGVLPKQDTTLIDDSFSKITPADSANNYPKSEVVKPIDGAKTSEKPNAEAIKPVEKTLEDPKKVTFDNVFANQPIGEQLKQTKAWITLNADFRKNSAELSSKGDLDEVVKYLKANRKSKIVIAGGSQSTGGTLGEDRAYAIREVLLERGVNEGQVSVQSSSVKDVDSKVVLKVK